MTDLSNDDTKNLEETSGESSLTSDAAEGTPPTRWSAPAVGLLPGGVSDSDQTSNEEYAAGWADEVGAPTQEEHDAAVAKKLEAREAEIAAALDKAEAEAKRVAEMAEAKMLVARETAAAAVEKAKADLVAAQEAAVKSKAEFAAKKLEEEELETQKEMLAREEQGHADEEKRKADLALNVSGDEKEVGESAAVTEDTAKTGDAEEEGAANLSAVEDKNEASKESDEKNEGEEQEAQLAHEKNAMVASDVKDDNIDAAPKNPSTVGDQTDEQKKDVEGAESSARNPDENKDVSSLSAPSDAAEIKSGPAKRDASTPSIELKDVAAAKSERIAPVEDSFFGDEDENTDPVARPKLADVSKKPPVSKVQSTSASDDDFDDDLFKKRFPVLWAAVGLLVILVSAGAFLLPSNESGDDEKSPTPEIGSEKPPKPLLEGKKENPVDSQPKAALSSGKKRPKNAPKKRDHNKPERSPIVESTESTSRGPNKDPEKLRLAKAPPKVKRQKPADDVKKGASERPVEKSGQSDKTLASKEVKTASARLLKIKAVGGPRIRWQTLKGSALGKGSGTFLLPAGTTEIIALDLATGGRRKISVRNANVNASAGGVGTLDVRVFPFAQVFLGPKPLGTTPFAPLKLPAGTYSLRLLYEGKEQKKVVVIEKDRIVRVKARF
ncbi:MAG: hypothetical protein GY822_15665 [Deltaproteobacteria bacterium]|nr:hypothetical protein [Deltaproteobacteria bacterium]